MLKQQARLIHSSIFVVDLLLVTAAFLLAFVLRDGWLPQVAPGLFPSRLYPLAQYLPLLPVALLCWGFALVANGVYRSHRTMTLGAEVLAMLRVALLATVLWSLFFFLTRFDSYLLDGDRLSRGWALVLALLASLFLLTEKLAIRLTSRYVRQRGFNYRTMLIVGTNRPARQLAATLNQHGYWGFKLVGFVKTRASDRDPRRNLGGPLLGSLEELPRILEEHIVDDVFFSVSHRDLRELEPAFAILHEQGIRTRFTLDLIPVAPSRIELEEMGGMPLLSFSRAPTNYAQLFAKRAIDVGLALVIALIGLPLILVIALLIKVTSTGQVVYRQTRCGLNGRTFTLYKFRTMVEGAENRLAEIAHLNEMDGPAFKVKRDPRVTRVGRILRKFSLDELPQLWNVLRGDMSLVGPRPPVPAEVAQYSRWQRRRLSMKPGLTCLWQISGRNNVDFDRWMEMDLEYIDHWSPMLDMKIMLKTIPAVLSGRGAS